MSTPHRPHPLTGEWNGKEYDDNPDSILFDDCPRCKEHAKLILTLDDHNLNRLWDEMVEVEFGKERDHYRNVTEAAACAELYRMALFVRRVFGFGPKALRDLQGLYNSLSAV